MSLVVTLNYQLEDYIYNGENTVVFNEEGETSLKNYIYSEETTYTITNTETETYSKTKYIYTENNIIFNNSETDILHTIIYATETTYNFRIESDYFQIYLYNGENIYQFDLKSDYSKLTVGFVDSENVYQSNLESNCFPKIRYIDDENRYKFTPIVEIVSIYDPLDINKIDLIIPLFLNSEKKCYLCGSYFTQKLVKIGFVEHVTTKRNVYVAFEATLDVNNLRIIKLLKAFSDRKIIVSSNRQATKRVIYLPYRTFEQRNIYLLSYQPLDVNTLKTNLAIRKTNEKKCCIIGNLVSNRKIHLETIPRFFVTTKHVLVNTIIGNYTKRNCYIESYNELELNTLEILTGYKKVSYRRCFVKGLKYDTIRQCWLETAPYVFMNIELIYPKAYSLINENEIKIVALITSFIRIDIESIKIYLDGEALDVDVSVKNSYNVKIESKKVVLEKNKTYSIEIEFYDTLGNTYKQNYQFFS